MTKKPIKRRKKTTKKQEKKVVDTLAVGKSTRKAAEVAKVSQTTVMRIKEEKQDEIEVQTRRLMKAMPDIVDSIARDIKTSDLLSKVLSGEKGMDKIPKLLMADKAILTKFMDLSYKMKTDVLRAIGIFPSQSRSIFIENLIASGGKAVINPKVLHVVGEHLKSLIGSAPIEVKEEKEEEEE